MDEMIKTDIVLNFKSPNINTIVHAKQNDRLSRYVLAYMKDGDSPWEPPERLLATVRYKKADGHIGFYDVDENGNPAVTFDDNIATIYLAEQALTAPGPVLMELTLYTPQPAGERLSSFYFILEVEESAMADDDFESTDYFNILTYEITQLLARIDSIAGVTAEAHAIPYGQETYVVVTGGTGIEDPYHMKFYIESAKPINPRGNYNAQTTYNIIDLVFYNGDSYLALKDNVKGVTPGTDSAKWQKISTAAKVSSQTYQYATQTEAAYTGEPPQTGWQNNPPVAIPGGYLWAKIVTTYTDGSNYTTYNVTRNGQDGTGSPGSATPLMDGTASAGTANTYSRQDHRHPTDSTRATFQEYQLTIPANAWIEYQNNWFAIENLSCPGVLSTDSIIIDLQPEWDSAKAEIVEAYTEAYGYINSVYVGNNAFTIYALGGKPSVDIPVNVLAIRKG